MDRSSLIACMACLLCFFVLLLPFRSRVAATVPAEAAPPATESPTPTVSAKEEPVFDEALTLCVNDGGQARELTLHAYLVGVLAAEMPADFPEEALKAQAIASRTYALRRLQSRQELCTSSACCQGWRAGAQDERFEHAVQETDGLVVTYQGTLIDATFFSSSGGSTEAAAAVWGSDVPYLQSVESPETPCAQSTEFSAEEFSFILEEAYPEMQLTGTPSRWFGPTVYTDGGGVETVEIGGISVRGTVLRTLLGLRSTDMTIDVRADTVCITTHGFGHRVGLSQHGAKAMAEDGSDFEAILTHYYQGCTLRKLCLAENHSS